MPAPSIARDIFDEIMSHFDDAARAKYLRGMVNSKPPTYESEHLAFKVGSVKGAEPNEDDVVRNWSKAVSGFANSGGGVLVWGLEAKEKGTKIDQVIGCELVLSPDKLKTRLRKLLLDATDPPVPGIEIEAIPDPADDGKGFVVCFIPESDYKPHRADQDNGRWRMRVSDNFVDIPPPLLRSLFFPRRQSYIWMEIDPHLENDRNAPEGHHRISFRMFLTNDGPATATQLNLVKLSRLKEHGQALSDSWWRGGTHGIDRWRYPEPLHAGDKTILGAIIADVPMPHTGCPGASPEFRFRLMALDQPPQLLSITFSPRDLEAAASKRADPVPLDLERFKK